MTGSDLEAEVEHLRYLLTELTSPPPEWCEQITAWGLTRCQGAILSVLMKSKGQVVGREKLLAAVIWAQRRQDDGPEIKVVDVQVCKIRQMLRKMGAPFSIRTVHRVGYMIEGAA